MKKNRILVVEDEAIVARDIVRQLERLGHEPVGRAARGEEAVELAVGLRPDLVLMDIQLAGAMNGIEAADRVRELCDIPVVFLTAFAGDDIVQKAKQTSPFGYIVKPFDLHQLRLAVEMALYRHAIDANLRRSREELALVLRTAPDAVWLLAPDGRFLDCNEAACRLTGRRREELLALHLADLEGEAAGAEPGSLDAAVRAGGPRQVEGRLAGAGDHWVDVEIRVNPLPPPDGRWCCFVRDVTERKRLEAQVRQMQKIEAIGRLAGGVAHDFNNVLAAFMMHVGLLRQEPGLSEEMQTDLRDLEAEARRAATITRQLLMFSRRQVAELRAVDLDETLTELLKMVRRLLGETVQIDYRSDGLLPAIEADPGMIDQVVMNLCINARDAMARGGRIVLSTRARSVADTEAALNPEARPGRFVELAVADTGCGMSDEVRRHLFEPFFTTKEPGKGTGLGLATVHGIVKQHGGWIDVQSAVDRGTTFRILLPARNGAHDGGSPKAAAGALPRGGGCRVLVVEDETSVRRALAAMLRRFDYEVLEAASGPEALRIWEERHRQIAVLVTDMVLPGGMTGAALVEQLRQAQPALAVVVCSGYSDRQTVPDAPGIAVLAKPFETANLLNLIQRCLAEVRDLAPRTGTAHE